MFKKFVELNNDEIILAIKKFINPGLVLNSLNCRDNGYNRERLKFFIKANNINISHFVDKLGLEKYYLNPKRCKYCNSILSYENRRNIFCNHSCAALYNNLKENKKGYIIKEKFCLNCGKKISNRNKYCNNHCKAQFEQKKYIKKWLNGEESGTKSHDDISNCVRRYLFEIHNNSCEICGWNLVNKYTGKVPLQIHHIDGDCMNNKFENLLLLCPNCHSLTENFGARNKNCTRIDKRIR